MQKLIDEEIFQEQKRLLALMADDFRERALIKMMDGVLQKRWEDEIKKNPIIPDCIKNQKNLNEYTKDDLKLIEEYNEKMKFLQTERINYQKILEKEQESLQLLRNEQIYKFNTRCNELFILKLRIDAAIKQEEIRFLRNQMFNFKKIQISEKQNSLM